MYDGASSPYGETGSISTFNGAEMRARGRPVFLHGMWRSGSTFLWSRFRETPDTCCFYEPLHHCLAKLTVERIAEDTPEQITAHRHPALSAPYFAEFAPLIRRKGVRYYNRRLAYHRFALQPDESHPKLQRYIAGLIDHGLGQGCTPVLGFNRTGLRLAWLKANFDAYNIYIDREPAAIWASYAAELARGNCGFYSMWMTVLENNAGHPVFAPLVERLALRPPLTGVVEKPKARHRRLLETMSDDETYFMVFYLWLACTGHALAQSDLLIDTRLAEAPHYPHRMAAEIAYATGLRVDLDEMRAAESRVDLPRSTRDRIERSAVKLFPRAALPRTPQSVRGLAAVSTRKADLLAAIL